MIFVIIIIVNVLLHNSQPSLYIHSVQKETHKFHIGIKIYKKVARTTECIFHQNIIIMFDPGDKGLFEKYRNATFSDFDANLRKISKFEKNFFSKSTCHFSLLSIRSGSADFKVI